MKPSSKYAELKHVVEACEPGKSYYEPIAAFNAAPVAIGYAEYAARTSPLYRYRVMQRTTGENFIQVHPLTPERIKAVSEKIARASTYGKTNNPNWTKDDKPR